MGQAFIFIGAVPDGFDTFGLGLLQHLDSYRIDGFLAASNGLVSFLPCNILL